MRGALLPAETALADLGVQRGEEQVLHDRAVVRIARVPVVVLQQAGDLRFGEQFGGDQPLFLDEPHEQQPRNQADDVFFGRQGAGLVGGEGRLGHGAGEPGEQRRVEAFVQRLGIQRTEQRGEQAIEGARLLVRGQPVQPFGQGQRVQDVEVGAVGVLGLDVADERDAAEHVAAGIALVRAAVDDGEGQPAGVAEQHDDRHGKQAVELAGHVGQRGAGIPWPRNSMAKNREDSSRPGARVASWNSERSVCTSVSVS